MCDISAGVRDEILLDWDIKSDRLYANSFDKADKIFNESLLDKSVNDR